MHENGSSRHETAKLGRSKGVREFGTKRPRVRIPPLRQIRRALEIKALRTFLRFGKCGFSVEKAVKIGRNLQKEKPGTVENQRRRAGRNWGKRAKRPHG